MFHALRRSSDKSTWDTLSYFKITGLGFVEAYFQIELVISAGRPKKLLRPENIETAGMLFSNVNFFLHFLLRSCLCCGHDVDLED